MFKRLFGSKSEPVNRDVFLLKQQGAPSQGWLTAWRVISGDSYPTNCLATFQVVSPFNGSRYDFETEFWFSHPKKTRLDCINDFVSWPDEVPIAEEKRQKRDMEREYYKPYGESIIKRVERDIALQRLPEKLFYSQKISLVKPIPVTAYWQPSQGIYQNTLGYGTDLTPADPHLLKYPPLIVLPTLAEIKAN